MSVCATFNTALATIRRITSPTPIGRTPGFLSKAMSLLETKGANPAGSRVVVAKSRVNPARAWQRLVDAYLNEEQILCQASASRPEGPADPCVKNDLLDGVRSDAGKLDWVD